jgi:hypothetical protein
LKRVLKHEALAPPLLKLMLNIPGLREGFEIGPWNKIIGAKCDEVCLPLGYGVIH